MKQEMDHKRREEIAAAIVDSALMVHKALGPGLLESAYQSCLGYELRERGIKVAMEIECPVVYKTIRIDCGYRIDMMIEDEVVIENKAVDAIAPIHKAQLLTYMKLTQRKLGFLINWNVPLIKDGLHRMIL
ncbi:MAG: GxxExxY protein [Candidatus Aureabacteria bacterium]|nr:GxxExxY protein [Candidatus Auribacterota bacterium]